MSELKALVVSVELPRREPRSIPGETTAQVWRRRATLISLRLGIGNGGPYVIAVMPYMADV